MIQLAPSVYAADYLHLREQLAVMEQEGIKRLHIDIMDGNFVPSLSFGPDFVAALRTATSLYLDVHLMVRNPIGFVDDFAKAGADGITVHWEALGNGTPEVRAGQAQVEAAGRVLDGIHSRGLEAGLALRPETPLKAVEEKLWEKVDFLQMMTVAPGLKGQAFIPDSVKKIETAGTYLEQLFRTQKQPEDRERNSRIPIGVDGDITPDNLELVLAAGAEIIVAGKGLFIGDLKQNIKKYRMKMEGKDAVCGGN